MPIRPALFKTFSLFVVLPFLFFSTSVVAVFICIAALLGQNDAGDSVKQAIEKPVYSIFNARPPVLGVMDESVDGSDGRAAILTQYFAAQHAPLAQYGEVLVTMAEKYGLDWKLLPAIAMQESNGGKKIPESSYNAWGWAIHSSSTKKFESWEQGIETVAKGLRDDYTSRGLTTPCQIMTRYNPISTARDGSWCKGVEYFISDIKDF